MNGGGCLVLLVVMVLCVSALAGYHYGNWARGFDEKEKLRERHPPGFIFSPIRTHALHTEPLRTNSAFAAYHEQMLKNLGEDAKSFSQWLNDNDRRVDQEAFDQWVTKMKERTGEVDLLKRRGP